MYSFSYLEPVCCSMSCSNCCFLTCIQVSQEAGQVIWYSHLFQNFPQFIVIHTPGEGVWVKPSEIRKWRDPELDIDEWEPDLWAFHEGFSLLHFKISGTFLWWLFFILSELKPSLNCSVFTEPSGSGPRMAQTWPIEGPTFLQDKGSYQLPHAFMLRLFFHSGSLSHSNFPCLPSSVLMPCWRLLLNRKMNTSWNDLPWKLWKNDHLNSDFVTVLLSQTVLIRIPAKAIPIFFFFLEPNFF